LIPAQYKEKIVRSDTRIVLPFVTGVIVLAALAGVAATCCAEESQAEKPSGNSKCYVCHPGMKTEELTANHLAKGITCDVCHGPSVEHMHDEMLMTKPDLLFGRSEVAKMCSNCHKPGQGRDAFGRQDHKDPNAVEAFLAKWTGRMRPNGRAVANDSVCTDCHGTHNISKPLNTQAGGEQAAEWLAAFNGLDLTGWKTSGSAKWSVRAGQITVAPPTTKKNGTLWTEGMYEDYLLAVTFRAAWPIHAGIWLRAQGSEQGPRVEISDSGTGLTGSVWIPKKGVALANLQKNLMDLESWNTLSVKVEGDRVQVWLNGQEIGAIRAAGPAKGKIGLYVAGSPASKSSELCVREVLVQKITHPEEKASTLGTVK
jgi:hypothetical protein